MTTRVGKEPKVRSYSMASVDRVASVLKALATKDFMTLTEVSRASGLDESTALRYLSSLVENALVNRDEESGRYTLGIEMMRLGLRAADLKNVRSLALRPMERLVEKYEETVNLARLQQERIVVVDVVESNRSIRKGASVGEVDIFHASSLGKAVLSNLDEESAMEILSSYPRERFTDNTLTDLNDLKNELVSCRERGYALDDEEYEEGLRCVGVAILDGRGDPTWAISISGFAPRMTPELVAEMATELQEVSASISESLGWESR